jgi:hypothetical protein
MSEKQDLLPRHPHNSHSCPLARLFRPRAHNSSLQHPFNHFASSAVLIYTSAHTLLWREIDPDDDLGDAGHRSSFSPSWRISTLPLTSLSRSSIAALDSSLSYARSLVQQDSVSFLSGPRFRLCFACFGGGEEGADMAEGDATRE